MVNVFQLPHSLSTVRRKACNRMRRAERRVRSTNFWSGEFYPFERHKSTNHNMQDFENTIVFETDTRCRFNAMY